MDSLQIQDAFEPYYQGRKEPFKAERKEAVKAEPGDANGTRTDRDAEDAFSPAKQGTH